MFNRFGKNAKVAVVLAQEEARELRSEWIEPGHLLLGLQPNESIAAAFAEVRCSVTDLRRRVAQCGGPELDSEALATLGIDLDQVRASVESRFGEGALDRPPRRWRGGHLPFSKAAKKSLEDALREAAHLRHREILDWHVLLGVIRAEPALVDQLVGRSGAHQTLRAVAEDRLGARAA